jgi:ABC-type nitrate/sulfonate/bicarbonate transport system permease component/MFS family permease
MSSLPSAQETPDQAGDRRFIIGFIALALVSGVTIGITKVVNALLAIHHGATPFQVSLVGAFESAGMFIITIPAGFLIEKYGPRPVYLISSVVAAIAYLLSPWTTAWWQLLPIAAVIGICIPFRVVSMSGSFLARLRTLGSGRSGWYRGSLLTGMLLLGPFIGSLLQEHTGFVVTYAAVSVLFLLMGNASLGVLPDRIQPQTAQTSSSVFGGVLELLHRPDVARPSLVEFAGGLTSGFFAIFSLLIATKQFGASPVAASIPLAVQGVAFVGVLFLAGRTLNWLPRNDYYRFAHVVTIAGLLSVGLGDRLLALDVGAGLIGIGLGMQHLANVHAISASSVEKGRASGLFTFAGTAGGFIGLLISGALTHWLSLQAVFLAWIPIFLLLTGPAIHLLPNADGALKPLRPRLWAGAKRAGFIVGYAALAVLAWHLAVRYRLVPPQVVVSPQRVWETLSELALSGELWDHTRASLVRVGSGFLAGSLAALVFGIAYSLWAPVRIYTRFTFDLVRQVPTVGWIPLLILLFGIEESFKILVIALSVFFPVALAVIDGIAGVPKRFLEVADVLRFNTRTRIFRVILPAAVPDIATGLRLGLSRAWMIVVGAELFGSESGLGHLMDWGRQLFQMDLILAAVLVTALIGYVIDRILIRIEGRFQAWKRNPAF